MKPTNILRTLIVLAFLSSTNLLMAQTSGSSLTSIAFGAVVIALLLAVLFSVGGNVLKIKAKEIGADASGENYGIFPRMDEIAGKKVPDYTTNGSYHKLKKGFTVNIKGDAAKRISQPKVNTYAVSPKNFHGMSPIPKVVVAVGDKVKAGDVLFYDKKRDNIQYCAPVSGEVVAINRGEKRSIKEVVILADEKQISRAYDLPSLDTSRETLIEFLLGSGVWPMITQRPYQVVADPSDDPKGIFISTFDTAPLAPDLSYIVRQGDNSAAFQKGLDVLNRLTSGKVHLGISANASDSVAPAFKNATGVEKHYFEGQHPVGNVGVQIHHIDAINAGERVWTLDVQGVITIGKLFLNGTFDTTRLVALAGAEYKAPQYVLTKQGANVGDLVKDALTTDHVRLVSGDPLSGKKVTTEEYLEFHADQLTSLEEGDYYEMFGWLVPTKPKVSLSRTFPGFLFPDVKVKADTNTHGEKRAFVVTGQYEQVLPMDIYPQHLMKSIIINDFEKMEGLGIYELAEEDVALCEFVCTSKQPLQQILRQGLDLMREQG